MPIFNWRFFLFILHIIYLFLMGNQCHFLVYMKTNDDMPMPESGHLQATPPPSRQWRLPPSVESHPTKVGHALRERIKELNCLYAVAHLAEQHPRSLDALLQGVVDILPPSWQYPDITCARITFDGRSVTTRDFRVTRWRQQAQIIVHSEGVGMVEVFYREDMPESYEGPFLEEERALIDAVAEHIGLIAARMATEEQLEETNRQLTIEREAIRETNAALRTVLNRIEDEKREIRKDIEANVEKILLPILHALAIRIPKNQRRYVDLLRHNLEDIAAPFVNTLSRKYRSLTPTEIRICKMIRDGMPTKEIAAIRGISPATISRHREHIRKKLGIANEAVNLTTYLQATM